MSNTYFQFKQFTVHQEKSAMKVTTDSCLFGSWVAREIKSLENKNSRILDIGAGTGLLSLMIAQQSSCPIDAIEIDEQAFLQAKENVAASPWHNQITLFHADVLDYPMKDKYDFIISNPPFYENELSSDNKNKNLAHHDTGLRLNELLSIIEKHLSPEGYFLLLLPYKRLRDFEMLLGETGLSVNCRVSVKQTVNHSGFRLMLKGSFRKLDDSDPTGIEIAIRDSKNEYTPAFVKLLQPYYLNL